MTKSDLVAQGWELFNLFCTGGGIPWGVKKIKSGEGGRCLTLSLAVARGNGNSMNCTMH